MTKEEALELIDQYCTVLKKDVVEYHEILTGLRDRFPRDGNEAKAMRWLGFMQGSLWTHGIYPLDELKRHSKERKVLPSE